MFVVQITPEIAPVAKVGGLADMVFGLSRELEVRGNAVEIIVPKYDCMWYDQIWGLHKIYDGLWVPWYGGAIQTSVWFGFVHGRKCFFIDPHSNENFFNRGGFYGFHDDTLRYAFFCKAALEFLEKTNKRPDVIHCHDWQSGLLPVLLFEMYRHTHLNTARVCFTIHNFKHQGACGEYILRATGLNRPDYYYHTDRLQDDFHPGALNMMKAGIVYSNFVTTVSPQHATEAAYTDQGCGLERALHRHMGKFGGVLNGLDYEVWNPEIDPLIASHFNVDNIDAKYPNKHALREKLWLRQDYKPLVAYVGRLDPQKGVHLIRHALFFAIWNQAQFVLLGSSGDTGINAYFAHLKTYLNDNPDCHVEIGFNEELAHQIYAGSDMIIVPSMYEPCGLTQMMGMRYGSVPIVRAIGGLVDTVLDRDYSSAAWEDRNGYVFQQDDYQALESAMHRAFGLWYAYPDQFRELIANGMRRDFSWNIPGQHYTNIFELIRDK